MDDISQALAFEVKKEIADRYFNFRKLIENNTEAYLDKITATALDLEYNIGLDLARIYSLLKKDSFVHAFLELINFHDDFFFDSYISSSPTIRKNLFSSQLIHGITAKIRYKNLFYETYRDLFNHINIYRKNLTKLTEEYDVICQEIKLFYQKNDINMIIQFFKNLDTPNNSPLSSQVDTSDNHIDLEKKLRIVPPVPAEEQLPEIPSIPQLKKIKSDLSQLLNRSFSSQANGDPRHFQL